MKYLIGLVLLFFGGCSDKQSETERKMIVIQPLGNFPESSSSNVVSRIRKINPNITIRNNIPLPRNAFYATRQRYRADSIIRFLSQRVGGDSVIVGLTEKDISTTKGEYRDWGVMGLAYCPGHSCIISTFRLKNDREDQFYKVVLHELGHTAGLLHCDVKSCFMRDAEGGNPLDSEIEFCSKCKSYLIARGWQLNSSHR